jgi:DNA-binding response OmpR family regulator
MRILILEDHSETGEMLEGALRDHGFDTDCVGDVSGAQAKLAERTYDVAVLDWMLPDGSGLDLCRSMRATGDTTPVLMLTARGDVADRVAGLDAGADDYLRKPFAVAELVARIRALTRRGPQLQEAVVRTGNAEVRLAERRVIVGGEEVPLTAREFAILELLLRARGRAVSRSDILVAVWGEETPGAASSLEVLISRLRRKLSASSNESPVRTHRGFGYSIVLES